MSSSVRIFAVAGTLLAWGFGLAGEAEARSFRLYDMEAALAEPYPLDVRPKFGASRMPTTRAPARPAVAPVRPMPTARAPSAPTTMPEPKSAAKPPMPTPSP